MNKIEQIRNGEAALYNCYSIELLWKATNIIWPNEPSPDGWAKYYLTDKARDGWCISQNTDLQFYTPKEIIDEYERVGATEAKKYKTRSGLNVELLTTNGRGLLPFVGYVEGDEDLMSWYADGRFQTGQISDLDIVEVVEEPPHKNPLVLKGIIEELKMLVERLEKL